MRIILRVFILLGFLQFIRCSSEKDSTYSALDGVWKAQWVLVDKNMQQIFSDAEITMDGEVIFSDNQMVEITAYGFDGCAFASDTATNQLIYDFQDSVLLLLNGEDQVVFSYRVQEKLPDQFTFLLMDDILLTLRR
jgi:hypothetical protein